MLTFSALHDAHDMFGVIKRDGNGESMGNQFTAGIVSGTDKAHFGILHNLHTDTDEPKDPIGVGPEAK